jgi:hypothetical protein
MSPINYTPWKGIKYDGGYRNGLKLLILGDSHYGGAGANHSELTGDEIRRHVEIEPYAFWTHIEQVIEGRTLSDDARRSFWDSVAFSNYFQQALDRPGVRPSDVQWERGRRAFSEIIDYTEPDILFVFSLRVWERLPTLPEFPGTKSITEMTDAATLWRVHGRSLVGGGFAHPRNPMVGRDIWHAWSEWLFSCGTKNLGSTS